MKARPTIQALAGLVAGAIALVIVTAILTAAISSSNTEAGLRDAVTQLQAIADRQEATANRLAAQRRIDQERQSDTLAARRRLMDQNAELQRQLRSLTNFLRDHGFAVPNVATRPGTSTHRPKAPLRHRSPASPAPTGPGPRSPSPSPNMACQLVPSLCPFLSLPTLLP